MSNNRTEQQAIISALAPTVDLVELKAAIRTNGYLFKKDVIIEPSSSLPTKTIFFTIADQNVLTITVDCLVSFSGLEDGQVAKLAVIKGALNIVSFNADGSVLGQQTGLTTLDFIVTNINGRIYVEQLNRQSINTIAVGEMAIGVGTINAVNYCDVIINNKVCHISGEISINTSPTAGLIAYIITIANNSKLGRFLRQNVYISGSANTDYNAQVGDAAALAIKDTGTGYTLRLSKDNDNPWPINTVSLIRFSADIIIK